MAQDSGAAVVFFLSNNGKARKHSRCVGGQGRKKGGGIVREMRRSEADSIVRMA